MCLLAICVSALGEYPQILCSISVQLFVFLLLSFKSSLFQIQGPCQMCNLHIFYPNFSYNFTFSVVCPLKEKRFSFCRSPVYILFLWLLVLLVLSLRRLCPTRGRDLLLWFSSNSVCSFYLNMQVYGLFSVYFCTWCERGTSPLSFARGCPVAPALFF